MLFIKERSFFIAHPWYFIISPILPTYTHIQILDAFDLGNGRKMKRKRKRTQTLMNPWEGSVLQPILSWVEISGRQNPETASKQSRKPLSPVIQESVRIPEFSRVYHGSRVSELTEVSESTRQRLLRGMQKPFSWAKSHMKQALRDRETETWGEWPGRNWLTWSESLSLKHERLTEQMAAWLGHDVICP